MNDPFARQQNGWDSEAIAQMLIRVSRAASSPLAPFRARAAFASFRKSRIFSFLGQATREVPDFLHILR